MSVQNCPRVRSQLLTLAVNYLAQIDLWQSVFRLLLERGLNREAVELRIMGGPSGLEGVFCRSFPRAHTQQRCQKHVKARCEWEWRPLGTSASAQNLAPP